MVPPKHKDGDNSATNMTFRRLALSPKRHLRRMLYVNQTTENPNCSVIIIIIIMTIFIKRKTDKWLDENSKLVSFDKTDNRPST